MAHTLGATTLSSRNVVRGTRFQPKPKLQHVDFALAVSAGDAPVRSRMGYSMGHSNTFNGTRPTKRNAAQIAVAVFSLKFGRERGGPVTWMSHLPHTPSLTIRHHHAHIPQLYPNCPAVDSSHNPATEAHMAHTCEFSCGCTKFCTHLLDLVDVCNHTLR